MATNFLFDGPEDARVTILLAHGAGAPMDSATMTAVTKALAAANFRVVRFEFAYMAVRRTEGSRRPPPKAETLIPQYIAAVDDLPPHGPLIIGGHSMGGRVASMAADALFAKKRIAGLLCLSYPFHPPEKPELPRTKHLIGMQTPALIVEGTRDTFGTPEEVAGYGLPPSIELLWLEDGDHDLRPRKKISGFSAADHMQSMADAVSAWAARIAP
jgi:predicted alpha/beta-hydrolase family hydrolase